MRSLGQRAFVPLLFASISLFFSLQSLAGTEFHFTDRNVNILAAIVCSAEAQYSAFSHELKGELLHHAWVIKEDPATIQVIGTCGRPYAVADKPEAGSPLLLKIDKNTVNSQAFKIRGSVGDNLFDFFFNKVTEHKTVTEYGNSFKKTVTERRLDRFMIFPKITNILGESLGVLLRAGNAGHIAFRSHSEWSDNSSMADVYGDAVPRWHIEFLPREIDSNTLLLDVFGAHRLRLGVEQPERHQAGAVFFKANDRGTMVTVGCSNFLYTKEQRTRDKITVEDCQRLWRGQTTGLDFRVRESFLQSLRHTILEACGF